MARTPFFSVPKEFSGLALLFGVISLVLALYPILGYFSVLFAPLTIILGVLSLKHAPVKAQPVVAIVLAVLSLIWVFGFGILAWR